MRFRGILLVLAACLAQPLAGQASDSLALSRRVVAAASLAAKEYALGVTPSGGQIVQPEEVDEAKLFIQQATFDVPGLPVSARVVAGHALTRIAEMLDRLAPPDSVRLVTDALISRITAAAGGPKLSVSKHGIRNPEHTALSTLSRLREAAEEAKIKLSNEIEVEIARLASAYRVLEAEEHPTGDVEGETVLRLELRTAVLKLSPRERDLVALRYGADLKVRQIAELLGERTNTIEVALHRALGRLRGLLDDEAPPAQGLASRENPVRI